MDDPELASTVRFITKVAYQDMSAVVELRIPAIEFALHETLIAIPTAKFEIARVVAHNNPQSQERGGTWLQDSHNTTHPQAMRLSRTCTYSW